MKMKAAAPLPALRCLKKADLLLLVPLACSLLGISDDIAMQVVGMIQDSCETALNLSADVLCTAVAELSRRREQNA